MSTQRSDLPDVPQGSLRGTSVGADFSAKFHKYSFAQGERCTVDRPAKNGKALALFNDKMFLLSQKVVNLHVYSLILTHVFTYHYLMCLMEISYDSFGGTCCFRV